MSELAMFPQNKPVEIEARNPRCSMRSAKIGYVHTINLEVDEETLALLKTLPKEAELKLVMWIHDHGDSQMQTPAVEEKPKKEAKPKGEYGKAWNYLFAKGFERNPVIQKWYGGTPDDTKEMTKSLLRSHLGAESLTFVSMDDLVARLNKETDCSDERWSAIVRQINGAREAQNNE